MTLAPVYAGSTRRGRRAPDRRPARRRTTGCGRHGAEPACWSHASTRAPPRAPAVDPRRPGHPGRSPPRRRRVAADFPKGWEGYHTYPEMVAEVRAVAAAHPGIVRPVLDRQELPGPRAVGGQGQRQRGHRRDTSPRSCSTACHHADEHMGLEMTLRILHWLADGYGSSARITSIVNTREIWIVFAMNPDGGAVRHQGRPVPLLAQEPPADAGLERDRDRPQPELRLPLGDRPAGRAGTPRRSRTTGPRAVLGARDPGDARLPRLAASSAAGSRSGPRSRSTRPAGS